MPAWRTRELARLVPELGEPSLAASDPQTERFRFFEAVTATLLHAAGMQPTLLILDDLHWADRATLLLLRHVLRNGSPVGPAVVAIYTDTTLVQRSGLRQLLADLRRDGAPEHLVVQGLDEESVRVLLGGRGANAAQLASTFHGLTDGNPLLLGELVRQSANSADQPLGSALFAEMAVPEAVKELVARRVSRLADNVNRFLQMAAVAGPEFDAGLVSSCAGMTADEELDILDSCVAAGVLVEVDGAPDRYAFTHGLYREAIYSELLRSRRFRMHDRLGDEIEQRQRDRLDHHLNELAYHFSRGALQANAQKAISYLIAAGDRARRALAFEEAVDQYRRAVDVVGRVGGGGAARGDALLALAEAQDKAGDGAGADRSFEEAASLARALGDTERLARAVRRGRPGL
jgi:predicted ATPase